MGENKIILFVTLGNRDLQIHFNAILPVNIFENHFDEGSLDSGQNYVIKKNDKLFIEHSKAIWDEYETCKDQVVFPMVQKYISLINDEPDEIIIITTKQTPFDAQDCHYVALFLERWLKEKYGYYSKYFPIDFSPVDFEKLVEYYTDIFDKYDSNQNLYFGNSGGTPDMRTASHFAGMFRGINFITIPTRLKLGNDDYHIKTYKKQEQLVLKHIVLNMLNNFDFSGLLSLPLFEEKSKLYAYYALSRISLDFEVAREYANKLNDIDLIIPDITNIRILESEMLQSARIKFHQKSYADYLWRLFTIADNLLIPDVEKLINGKIIYDKKNRHKKWNELIDQIPDLKEFLSNEKIRNSPLIFDEPNMYAYSAILKFFDNKNIWKKPTLLSNIEINLENLKQLRNAIAHNYKGISLEQINEKLVKKTFDDNDASAYTFNEMLCSYCNIEVKNYGIYSIICEKIKSML